MIALATNRLGPGQRAWLGLTLTVMSRAYRAFLLTLVVVAVAPIVWGWSAYTVRSASMEPALAVGDVVVARPFAAGDPVPVGRVMFFLDPAIPDAEKLLVHRVVERLDDGTYVTAGDANVSTDSTPVPSEAFQSRAVLLAPYVGLPVVWLRTGQLPMLALWSLLTIGAFVRASGPRRGTRYDDGDGNDGDNAAPLPEHAPVSHRAETARRALPVGLLAVALATIASTTLASAAFTSSAVNHGSTWAVGIDRYFNAVRADGPHTYYRLDEAGGTAMRDSGTGDRTGTYAAVSAYRLPGALTENPGHAVALSGQGRLVSGGPALTDPTTFSLELWFRTTTTDGGKLVGFESSRNATSWSSDRHVVMLPDGRLVYGAWDGWASLIIASPKAYNDGKWHHLVLTAVPRGQRQTSILYVDGGGVAQGTTSRTGYFSGWWRVGYGSLDPEPWLPGASFTGEIDEFAVFTNRLSSTRVSAHYAAR